MQTRLRIAREGAETGALLQEDLQERGVYSERGPLTVSYGIHLTDAPDPRILNGVCARGKVFNMRAMKEAGVRTVPFFIAGDVTHHADGLAVPYGFKFPAFARKSHGMGGKDLMPVFEPEEVPWRSAAGWDWFSSYVPFTREYRVGVFRNYFLDAYSKVMQRPSEYRQMGRNFGNGFEFQLSSQLVPDTAVAQAIKAVKALDLDFAAVDLLWGRDSKPYILECN